MAGELEEPFRINFQADLLHSGSISFGRFESESLSWERRSIFSHNRYLEEVEKYSKPGSVTEKKAYFEAEFRRKALLRQQSAECQDGGELSTSRNDDLHSFEESGNGTESTCSSDSSVYNRETKIQQRESDNVETLYAENGNGSRHAAPFVESPLNIGYDEDFMRQEFESLNCEFLCATTQDEPAINMVDSPVSISEHVKLDETHQSESDNVVVSTEQSIGVTIVDKVVVVDVPAISMFDCPVSVSEHVKLDETHQSESESVLVNNEQSIGVTLVDEVVLLDVASEANDSSQTCQTPKNDHDSTSPGPQETISPKVKPASEKKLTRATPKSQANANQFQKYGLNEASRYPTRPRTSEGRSRLSSEASKGSIKLKTSESRNVLSTEASKYSMRPRTSEGRSLPSKESSKGSIKPKTSESRSKPSSEASKYSMRPRTSEGRSLPSSEASKGSLKPRTSESRYLRSIEASEALLKPRTSESKKLPVKQTEKELPQPASPFTRSVVKSTKAEGAMNMKEKEQQLNKSFVKDQRSEKTVKAHVPMSEKPIPGARPTVNRPKQTISSSKAHTVQSTAAGFSFKTDQRAENRKEFYMKIAEKSHAKEVEINQVKAKTQEKREAKIKQFQRSLNFKAAPMPSFYNGSTRGSDQRKVTPISKMPNQPRPSSQSMATRRDKNAIKSSVPQHVRPGSATSSINRLRLSDTVGRNQIPEKKVQEKKNGMNLVKQKEPEVEARNILKIHAKC